MLFLDCDEGDGISCNESKATSLRAARVKSSPAPDLFSAKDTLVP